MTAARLAACAAALTALALTGVADADAVPFPTRGWFLPIGATLGGSIHHDLPNGFILGGEASVVNLGEIGEGTWVGGYADALWDFGPEEFRFTVGPEIGWGPFGVDIGYLGAARDGDYKNGIAARALLTVSLLSLYGRWGHEFEATAANYGEIGVLVKLPIPISEGGGRGRRPEPEDVDGGAPWQQPPPPPPPTLQVPAPEPPPPPPERDFATPP